MGDDQHDGSGLGGMALGGDQHDGRGEVEKRAGEGVRWSREPTNRGWWRPAIRVGLEGGKGGKW